MSTIQQLQFTRMYTLGKIKQTSKLDWDTQPDGFRNTIRWNAGHIYVVMETYLQKAIPSYEISHPEWISLFEPDSSPEQWKTEPPSFKELWTALREQVNRVSSIIEGKLQEPSADTVKIGDYHTMETVDAVVQFIAWHEGVHAGVIFSLQRALEAQQRQAQASR